MQSIKYLSLLGILCCSISANAQTSIKITDSMYEILKQISIAAIQLGDMPYSEEQISEEWIGNTPCSDKEINDLEMRLNLKLPSDYIKFLKITNGFSASTYVIPSFSSSNEIDYLRNVEPQLYEIWIETGNIKVGEKLKTAIQVGGFNEEQFFFLIPPKTENNNWEYWFFAAWLPGEEVYNSLQEYFESVLETTQSIIDLNR